MISALSVAMTDAGPDGDIRGSGCAPSCGTGDEAVFLRQGLFTP